MKVTGIQTAPWLSQAAVQSKSFEAAGYSVTGGVSSKPNPANITQGVTFAVYDDFDSTYFETGASNPSGLMWPRVNGLANGQPFRYSCSVPPIVRDAVAICPSAAEHAYYRIPFGTGPRTITQGNNQPVTHNGSSAYAFDFGTSANTTIRAARGGNRHQGDREQLGELLSRRGL